jgi:hypothetical protein
MLLSLGAILQVLVQVLRLSWWNSTQLTAVQATGNPITTTAEATIPIVAFDELLTSMLRGLFKEKLVISSRLRFFL